MPRELHIQTFEWKGSLRYRCPECAFDTYTLHGNSGMLYHIAKAHSAKPAEPNLPTPKLFDGTGKEIQPEQPIVGGDDVLKALQRQDLIGAHVYLHKKNKPVTEDAVRDYSSGDGGGPDAEQELPLPSEDDE